MNSDHSQAPINVILYQPEIPQNTGNIGRTCVSLGAKLWIVRPAGFRMDSARLQRSGMDYWEQLEWECVANWDELVEKLPECPYWMVTKFGTRKYFQAEFERGCGLVIGRESNGLPDWLRNRYQDRCIQIPMPGGGRSLNQSSAASVVMYEAAKKIGLLDGVA